MLKTILSILLLLCCLSLSLQAQKGSDRPAANTAFDKGVQLLLDGKPKKALKPFREAVKLDTGFIAARRFLGLSQELNGQYTAAADNYQRVLSRDSSFSRLLYYQLGKIYYKMARPELAIHYLEKFESLQARDIGEFGRNGETEAAEERKAMLRLENDLKAARITQDSTQLVNVVELYNLGYPINTRQNDYFPFFANDMNSVLFTRQGGFGDEDLLQGKRKDKEAEWFTSRFGSFNTTQPEGTCSLVRDGERIYFTLCKEVDEPKRDKDSRDLTTKGGSYRPVTRECGLYAGWLIDGKIKDIEHLPEYISTPGYWETQATISCDEQLLFFVSNRPGGLGGSDIYVCERLDDGSWGEPKNLGDGVNTSGDEEAPFLSNDGQNLYFSSTGHRNLGDEDIFVSWWDDKQKRFTKALNVGVPINSPHRELGFHLSSDGKTGFVASDRPGGWGKLDIYGFELDGALSNTPITYVSGYVTDSLTGEPLVDQAVPLDFGPTYYTNYEGRFFICAPANNPLPLTVNHPDYLLYARNFAVPPWENLKPYRIDLLMSREKVEPPPAPEVITETAIVDTIQRRTRIKKRHYTVLFNFEDASLTTRAIDGLQIFVDEVKNKNITNINITGYTDDVGDQEFNVKLSHKRARAVSIHLQTAGVKANEVSIKGMGEIPGAAQKALNRKVEITVTFREVVEIR